MSPFVSTPPAGRREEDLKTDPSPAAPPLTAWRRWSLSRLPISQKRKALKVDFSSLCPGDTTWKKKALKSSSSSSSNTTAGFSHNHRLSKCPLQRDKSHRLFFFSFFGRLGVGPPFFLGVQEVSPFVLKTVSRGEGGTQGGSESQATAGFQVLNFPSKKLHT